LKKSKVGTDIIIVYSRKLNWNSVTEQVLAADVKLIMLSVFLVKGRRHMTKSTLKGMFCETFSRIITLMFVQLRRNA
jgi:hypothetical protein